MWGFFADLVQVCRTFFRPLGMFVLGMAVGYFILYRHFGCGG